MRRLYTLDELHARGLARSAIRSGADAGRWRRVCRGVYAAGPDEPTPLDVARAAVLAARGVASGTLAGVLHGLDGVDFSGPDFTVPATASGRRPGARRRDLASTRIVRVDADAVTSGLQTMVDLADILDDVSWEHALESALRKRLTSVADIEAELAVMGVARTPGTARVRRVLALRPPGAVATGSLLETLMAQLIRTIPGLPDPVRQYLVLDEHGQFVAYVDFAWPELGLFIELDGQQHLDQPVYDARRETAVVAATGWLCGRFTWTEVVHVPRATARRLERVALQARRRPPAA